MNLNLKLGGPNPGHEQENGSGSDLCSLLFLDYAWGSYSRPSWGVDIKAGEPRANATVEVKLKVNLLSEF